MITLHTATDTRGLGARLADLVRAGDLIVLDGPLGAGKTVLVQGLAAGLGASGPVTSPTFVIARVHRGGRLPLVHVDAYRLAGWLEVDDLDLDTELDGSVAGAVVAVEWGAGLVEALTDAHLRVELTRQEGEGEGESASEERVAVLRPVGGDWVERLRDAGLPVGS